MKALSFTFDIENYSSDFDHVDNEEKWSDLIEKILSFTNLSDDWDGEGARTPEEEVINSLLYYLLTLKIERKVTPPNRAIVTDEGGVIVEWQLNDGVAELETDKAGIGEVMFAYDDGETEFESLQWKTAIDMIERDESANFYSSRTTTTSASLYLAA